MRTKRQNIQLELALEPEAKGEARSAGTRGTEVRMACAEPERPAAGRGPSMEAVVEAGNLRKALARVRRNKGAPGLDGMTVGELGAWLKEHWPETKSRLLGGTYEPQPVRRVEIPKASGGVRPLGVPTVLDRFIQQAVLQVLQGDWDGSFSDASYGFRPGRSAHQAVKRAQDYIRAGSAIVVDLDLEKFFDRVNHDILMGLVAKRVADKRLLRLVRGFLTAGVLDGGLVGPTTKGTPQGGPMTPRTQKATSALSGRSWDGGTVLWLICAVNGNTLMANGSLHTSPKGRATQRRLHTARPGRDGERSRDASVAALWVVAASVVSLCPGRARHGPGGRTRRSADPNHHQDSGHAGGDVARICQEQRRVHRRDRRASSETLVLADRSSWLNIGQAFAPPFTSITPSTACSTPSFRTPTPSWCPIGPTLSRPGRTT